MDIIVSFGRLSCINIKLEFIIIMCLLTEDVEACLSNPCMNKGTCNKKLGEYTCTCAVGFAGPRCGSLAESDDYDSGKFL